jgi:hypothetical protein
LNVVLGDIVPAEPISMPEGSSRLAKKRVAGVGGWCWRT